MEIKRVVAIGGSDPSGGAGLETDVLALSEIGVFPYFALTSVTAQNSEGIQAVENIDPEFVTQQLESIFADGDISGVKIGMLGSRSNTEAVAGFLEERAVSNLVVDPILVASDGTELLSSTAFSILKIRLFPLTTIVTPNLSEAERLAGFGISDLEGMKKACKAIHIFGSRWVLIKGGHLRGSECIDVLFNGERYYQFTSRKIDGGDVRGTGCIFAAALTASLAKGDEVPRACEKAKRYVTSKIRHACQIGKGSRQTLPLGLIEQMA
jgi:hydroxymethylpyrimidine kinase/phosphomethylpyrimidine kinase